MEEGQVVEVVEVAVEEEAAAEAEAEAVVGLDVAAAGHL